MSVQLVKTVKFLIPDDGDRNFSWWAEYEWHSQNQIWFCKANNSGFMEKYNFPWQMTDQEMTFYMVKYG